MKLYIIGNRVDLHHGIQSSYFDFKGFLEKNDPDVYEVVNRYLANVEDFWSAFEENLAYLDEDSILDHASNYLVDYGADDWSDAYQHDYQYEINEIIQPLTSGLRKIFIEWILQLEIKHKKNQTLDIKKDSLFISFNYTPTLEKLYQIKSEDINYIHGKTVNSDSAIIFGHNYIKPNNKPDLENIRLELGDEAYQDYIDELGAQDVRVTKGQDILNSYFEQTLKPTESVIKANEAFFKEIKNINEVVILGQSLSDVDMPYFETIFNNINSAQVDWTISYHDKNDIFKHRQALKNIGVQDGQINNVQMDSFYPKEGVLFS